MNIGQVLDTGDMKVRLADIAINKGSTGAAILDILDPNDAVIKNMIVPAGGMKTIRMPTGAVYAIYAKETAPGITLNAKWANLDIYKVNGNPDTGSMMLSFVERPSSGTTLAASGLLAMDQELFVNSGASSFKARLSDLSKLPSTTGSESKPAIISILDSNDAVVMWRVVPVGKGILYISPTNERFVIYVESTSFNTQSLAENAMVFAYRLSASDSANQAPVITDGIGGLASVKVGEANTWSVDAYDPENGSLTYSIIWGDEPTLSKTATKYPFSSLQQATFTHIYYSAGTYSIVVTVTDDKGATAQAAKTVTATGSSANQTKTVKVVSPLSGATLTNGQTYAITWSYSPDMANYLYYIKAIPVGKTSGYLIYNDIDLNVISKGSYSWNVDVPPGDYKIRVGIQPEGAAPYFDSGTVKIADAFAPDLAVASITPQSTSEVSGGKRMVNLNIVITNKGQAASGTYDVNVYDENGAQAGASRGNKALAPGESRAYIPGGYLSGGWHTMRAVLSNFGADSNTSNNELSKQFYVEPVPIANRAPTISSTGGPTTINVGQSGTWSISAYDPDGNYLSYKVTWGDENMKGTAPQVSSAATFTHTYSSAGAYTITYVVTDDKGATAQATLTVTVSQPQTADAKRVSVTSPSSSATLTTGQTYTITWSYSPDMANYLYYIQAIPAGSSDGYQIYSDSDLNVISKGSYSWNVDVPPGSYKIRVGIQPEGAAPYFDGPSVNIVDPIPAVS
jgi:hypothetical protein